MKCHVPALLFVLAAGCGSELPEAAEPVADEAAGDEAAEDQRPSIHAQGPEEGFELRRAAVEPAPARRRPDPRTVFAVSVDGAPARGAADALVTMVVAHEFACRFCEKVRPTLDQLLREYRGNLRVVYRDFVVHPREAATPALAACAAHRQGRFFEMADLIWSRSYPTGDFGRRTMERLARSLHLDIGEMRRDMEGTCRDQLRASQRSLAAIGTRGTPTFWINGRTLTGARPIDHYRELIDAELARARRRLGRSGTTRRNYYRTWVLERGDQTFTALSERPQTLD